MNKTLQMFVFIIVMGLFSSGVLLGMDALTRENIEANKEVALRQKLLDANKVSYTTAEINSTYESTFTVIETGGLTFYENTLTGDVTFIFIGNGVWGPISGVLTTDASFETILGLEILFQEETPGLGGRITEEQFLVTFEGLDITGEILIRKDPAANASNEVDSITGATATSSRFETLLNNEIARYRAAWLEREEDQA